MHTEEREHVMSGTAPDRVTAPTTLARELDWWHGAVVYENHLPSFRDGSGDGIGDLEGLIESLDYLHGMLGVDAIWVGPFFRSPLLDQGYDVADYLDVEPVFGTLEVFDRLVAEAHARGLRVIVDYIPNHTSHLHPWFVESRSSRDNPRSDWYVWRDPAPGGGVPNNWNSEAGGSVWEWDATREQYYLHSHLIEQPDLNWRNPDVVAALHDVLRFWLDRGVDGFRIDVAHMLMKHPEFLDHPLVPDAEVNPFELQHPDFFGQLHIYDRRHPDTHDAMRGIREVVDEYPGAVTIAEIEAMPWEDWAEYYGRDLGGIHLPFAFRVIETPWEAAEFERELRDMYAALPPGAWPIIALGNHDRMRLATRVGTPQARVAAVILLTLRATPCFLYGDELGLEDQPVPLERQRDTFARSIGGVTRDPARTPMPWTTGHNAGYSAASPDDTWLPVPADAGERSVERQLEDPDSFLDLYRSLIHLRKSTPALRHGDIEIVSNATEHGGVPVIGYIRSSGSERIAVLLNFSHTGQPAPAGLRGVVIASTHRSTVGARFGDDTGAALAADQALVIRLDVQGMSA